MIVFNKLPLNLLGFAVTAKTVKVHPDKADKLEEELVSRGHTVRRVPRETVR